MCIHLSLKKKKPGQVKLLIENLIMKMEIFKLRPEDEFIPLINLLKLKNIAQSGGHAKMMVEEGEVKVNGEQEFRKRRKLRLGDVVELEGITIEIGTQP